MGYAAGFAAGAQASQNRINSIMSAGKMVSDHQDRLAKQKQIEEQQKIELAKQTAEEKRNLTKDAQDIRNKSMTFKKNIVDAKSEYAQQQAVEDYNSWLVDTKRGYTGTKLEPMIGAMNPEEKNISMNISDGKDGVVTKSLPESWLDFQPRLVSSEDGTVKFYAMDGDKIGTEIDESMPALTPAVYKNDSGAKGYTLMKHKETGKEIKVPATEVEIRSEQGYETIGKDGSGNTPTSYKEFMLATDGKGDSAGYRNYLKKRYTQPVAIKDEFGNTIGYQNVGKGNLFTGKNNTPVVKIIDEKGNKVVPTTKNSVIIEGNTTVPDIIPVTISRAKLNKDDLATMDTIPSVNNLLEKMKNIIPVENKDGTFDDSDYFGWADTLQATVGSKVGLGEQQQKKTQKVASYNSALMSLIGKAEMKGVLSDQDLKLIGEQLPNPNDSEAQASEKYKFIIDKWTTSVNSFNERMNKSAPQAIQDEIDTNTNRPSRTINGVTKYWDGKKWIL